MSLLPPATLSAAKVNQLDLDTKNYLRSQLIASYATVYNNGNPQPVLDAMGTNASAALNSYSVLYEALNTLGVADGVPPVVLTIYVPNSDGTVTYVPAPIPPPPTDP